VWFGKGDACEFYILILRCYWRSIETLLTEFVALHPDCKSGLSRRQYIELYYRHQGTKKPQASLVVSSAMDLHLKLVKRWLCTKPTSLVFTNRCA